MGLSFIIIILLIFSIVSLFNHQRRLPNLTWELTFNFSFWLSFASGLCFIFWLFDGYAYFKEPSDLIYDSLHLLLPFLATASTAFNWQKNHANFFPFLLTLINGLIFLAGLFSSFIGSM